MNGSTHHGFLQLRCGPQQNLPHLHRRRQPAQNALPDEPIPTLAPETSFGRHAFNPAVIPVAMLVTGKVVRQVQ